MLPDFPSISRGLQTIFLGFYGKKVALKCSILVHFTNFSRGACLRKCRKDFLPIFHAILFAENEIVHDH